MKKKPVKTKKKRPVPANFVGKTNHGSMTEAEKGEANRKRFLQNYVEFGTITQAADASGIHRLTHFTWMKKFEDYPEQFENAKQEFADKVESELLHRAVTGLVRHKFYKGQPIQYKDPATGKVVPYTEREPSDNLLMFWLKGRRPEIFKDLRELNLNVGDIDKAITDELDRLANRSKA